MRNKQLEIKEITAEGAFRGLLSPYGTVDQGGDVVLRGAYTKTLLEQGKTRPILWQHKQDQPIGQMTLDDQPDGLWCDGQLLMELPEAKKAYLLIKASIIKGLSIGFNSVKDSIENGVRKLSEIKLFEGSIVTFPMHESALITSVKAQREAKGDFNEELTEIQLSEAGWQMRSALSCALSSIVWVSDLTRDEKITASQTVIDQFAAAYMAYIPQYLDMLSATYGEMETWNAKRFETKAGAKISAATRETMNSACSQIKTGHDTLLALASNEAGDEATSKAGAVGETKTEPAVDHSAAESLIDQIRSLFQAA